MSEANVVMLKKLTPANVMGVKVKTLVQDTPIKLYSVIGVASGIKSGEHPTNGPWTLLMGAFEAVRDGKRYISTECAIPQPFHDMIVKAVRGAPDAEGKYGESRNVEFACDVILKKNDSVVGYEYTAELLMDQQDNDPLAALRNKLSDKLALAAPSEPTQEPAKTEKTAKK